MSDAPDTAKSSAITDHPFVPRVNVGHYFAPYLCGWQIDSLGRTCNLAEAAHAETTVQR